MARRRSYRRSSSRSKGRRSRTSTTRSGHTLPIVPLAIAAGGAYLLWQHIQQQKALATAAAVQAAGAAAMNSITQALPSF